MGKDFKGYYEYLEWEMEKYRGSYDDYIFNLPDLFKLLCSLLNKDIGKKYRIMIACALGYFVAPKDVVHEDVYGPAGLVDDIFLCCYVLDKIRTKYGEEFLEESWKGNKDFKSVFNYAFKQSTMFVEGDQLRLRILQYVGLK